MLTSDSTQSVQLWLETPSVATSSRKRKRDTEHDNKGEEATSRGIQLDHDRQSAPPAGCPLSSPLSTPLSSALSSPSDPSNPRTTVPRTIDNTLLKSCRGSQTAKAVLIPPCPRPISSYRGYTALRISEESAISLLFPDHEGGLGSAVGDVYADESFVSVKLTNFTIYRELSNCYRKSSLALPEYASLRDLCVKTGYEEFFFDGRLITSTGHEAHVTGIPFHYLNIGGYQDVEQHAVGDDVWIQSKWGQRHKIWYRLKRASTAYSRFHTAFLWLANFAKYFVDFLSCHEIVNLNNFMSDFASWLIPLHDSDLRFRRWFQEYGILDFRKAVACHAEFLYSQASLVDIGLVERYIWSELLIGGQQLIDAHPEKQRLTVVTPLVYECFKELPFASFLQVLESAIPKADAPLSRHNSAPKSGFATGEVGELHSGDVVVVKSDPKHVSKWRGDESYFWFAYVREVRRRHNGYQDLRVIWLYAPVHTTICSAAASYPLPKELFMSKHCSCSTRQLISSSEVIAKVPVTFTSGPGFEKDQYFVRQTFDDSQFFTFKADQDFLCPCEQGTDKQPQHPYKAGDAVLIETDTSEQDLQLEPVLILESPSVRSLSSVRVQRFKRKQELEPTPKAPENELVLTFDELTIPQGAISHRCLVRFLPGCEAKPRKKILLTPHTRAEQASGRPLDSETSYLDKEDGRSTFFVKLEERDGRVHALSTSSLESVVPPALDPELNPITPLRGMDLFSGSGNFGRGLAEGGAVHMEWAIDIDAHAIHSYHANDTSAGRTRLFLGSVNDYLAKAVAGEGGLEIARRGEVEFISAGSPCVGWSLLNSRKASEKSQRACSLVTATLSFIDFYRPKYALLENVAGMALQSKDGQTNVLSHVISCLVYMGYQTQLFNLDAWSFGDPQTRTRLFVSISKPGLSPLPFPSLSHRAPVGMTNRCLGRATNGLAFGERKVAYPAPFDHVTFGEATGDLPLNWDGQELSIRHPDHMPSISLSPEARTGIACIPRYGVGYPNLSMARRTGLVSLRLQGTLSKLWKSERYSKCGARSWERNKADGLVPTVTTVCRPADAFHARWLHPFADRPLTVLEVRRAQGIPDHEVLIGSLARQWKQVGNAVARGMARALGRSLLEACRMDAWPLGSSRSEPGVSHGIENGMQT